SIRKKPGLRYRVVTAAVALGVAALAFALLLRAFSGERTPLATNGSSPNGAIATVGRGPDKLPGVQNIDVIAIDPATGAHVDLTPDPARESEPTWSADGSRVAFMRTWSTGTPGVAGQVLLHEGLFTMNADGSDLHEV